MITPSAEPTEKSESGKATQRTELVYVPVADDVAVNGVKAADHPAMADALKTVGDALDGASVDLLNKDKLMDAGELARFDRLSAKERLLVALEALGFDGAKADTAELSEDARALVSAIGERLAGLSESEAGARQTAIDAAFQPRLIVVDGQEYESVGLVLVVTENGKKSYERYTFFKDDGAWKLNGIEKGEYRVVG